MGRGRGVEREGEVEKRKGKEGELREKKNLTNQVKNYIKQRKPAN